METPGSLIDKLCTVNNKMFVNQEFIYEVRKMTYDEFREAYDMPDTEKARKLYDSLHKCCDLNVQRNKLIHELDKKLEELFVPKPEAVIAIDPHKTY